MILPGGNEYKVVNWLRAAAIIAQIDPVANGCLMVDNAGHLRRPALRQLGNNLDLADAGRPTYLRNTRCTISPPLISPTPVRPLLR